MLAKGNEHTTFDPRADNGENRWPCMLDMQHHKSQHWKNVLMQWLHGSFPPHKILWGAWEWRCRLGCAKRVQSLHMLLECQNILVASPSLTPATSYIASWGSFQLSIHHCRICEHPDMEDGFLTALILLLTPRWYLLSCVLQQRHRWSDGEWSRDEPPRKDRRDLRKAKNDSCKPK
jgi:hypothetical protein